MKQTFWKHQLEILFFWPLSTILSLSCFVVGIVMTTKKSLYRPILAMGIFLLIICIYAVFFRKETLCKITFLEEKIIVKRLNKTITTMQWFEIIDVKGNLYGNKGGRYMSFISQNNQIDVVPTKKMYNAIIEICPSNAIKNKINNIECFKSFH